LTPATSLGFSAVDFAQEVLGIRPLPWQRWLLIHAHELRPDGRFRFRTLVVLVARQNGKTSIVEVKNLWKMFVLGVPLVIGTAQNLDISEESWDKAVEIIEGTPELAAEVAHIDRTNGKKAIRTTGGSRWKIAAASRRGGRGLSGDDVNLDELREHQTWDAWGAVSKTTMARRNAQVWAFSNAGDDKSIVLNELQKQARAAAENPELDPTLGLFEWSAPDDVKCTCGKPDAMHEPDCRLLDRAAWAAANPSLGYTVTEEALSRFSARNACASTCRI
jgi:phage terminase large subunit-like protein